MVSDVNGKVGILKGSETSEALSFLKAWAPSLLLGEPADIFLQKVMTCICTVRAVHMSFCMLCISAQVRPQAFRGTVSSALPLLLHGILCGMMPINMY